MMNVLFLPKYSMIFAFLQSPRCLQKKIRQESRNIRIIASTKIEGTSSLPSVYPVKVIYPLVANIALMTRARATDICVTLDQVFNVGSSRDPYIKKLL